MRDVLGRRGGSLGQEVRVGGRTNDPSGNSLRLLPSGPDRVGEAPVRRRPPARSLSRFGGQVTSGRGAAWAAICSLVGAQDRRVCEGERRCPIRRLNQPLPAGILPRWKAVLPSSNRSPEARSPAL